MKITENIIAQISTALADGILKIDDNKKAIVVCLDGKVVEALAVNKEELVNVSYTENKKSTSELYIAYKNSQPIKSRVVDGLSDNVGASNKDSREANFGGRLQGGLAKICKLRREIQTLILKMQAKGVSCTSMEDDKNCKDQSQVIRNLEGIKLRAEDALRNASQTLTKENIIDVTKKIETVFKETNGKVIDLIAQAEDMEKRIFSDSSAYQYSRPNHENTDLNSRISYWEKRCCDAVTALSKIGGEKLTKNNPRITDLSDEDRPLKLAEIMLNIYDNEWSDAIEEIEDKDGNVHEELAVAILYETLMTAHKVCQNNKTLTGDEKEAMVLKEIESAHNSVKFGKATNAYIKSCAHLCTNMIKQDVPLVFGKPPERGSDMDKNLYKGFMTFGNKVDYLVWPSLFLYEGGALLSIGVVQLKETT